MTELSVWNLISLSELGVLLSPVYYYIITRNIEHIHALIGLFLTATAVESIKKFILPTWSRPRHASDCDLFCMDGNQEHKPGMPSGHSALIAFYTVFYNIKNPLFLLYVVLVATSRYFKRCHSIPQIIAGLLFGSIAGYLFKRRDIK